MVRFSLRPGNAFEGHEVHGLLKNAPGRVGCVVADKLYDISPVRDRLAEGGIVAVIPPMSNRKRPAACDMEAYKSRHLVENAFADLKQFRGVATRYCKLAVTFSALVCLVCVVVNTRESRRGASPYSPR